MSRPKQSYEVLARVEVKREPGHLYFIDKDGDLAKRRANRGHTPSGPYGENHPIKKVVRLGIKKVPGHLYYFHPKSATVRASKMRRGRPAE